MPYTITLEKFEGPLDLLLQLIEQDKLDITEVSLSRITEQYLKYLETIERLYPEELADFLVIATKLLLLKSRLLLPDLEAENDEEESLTEQLRLYKRYVEVAKLLDAEWRRETILFNRPWPKRMMIEPQFIPPHEVNANILRRTFERILRDLEPLITLPKSTLKKIISLKEKMIQIQELISNQAKLSFSNLLAAHTDRGEVVITFLALLELIKQQRIMVQQTTLFSDIIIHRNNKT